MMFIGFNKIFGDPGLAFFFCIFMVVVLVFILLNLALFYRCFYYPYIKNPIKKYIQKRNERLMIKISSNLKLRKNNKTQYLKLV